MIVTNVRVFSSKKLSKRENVFIERSISNIAKHLTDAAECTNYPAHRKYHFKLAYEAFATCTVEYALTEQARQVVDYDSFCNFMAHVGETTKSLGLMSRADRQLLTNLLTDAINLSFRWIKLTKANMELIIDIHGTRIANANTVPFSPVKEAA